MAGRAAEGIVRGDIDDASAAAADHAGGNDLAHPERAAEIGFDHFLPTLLGQVEEGRALNYAGRVHQHMDRTKLLLGCGNGPFDRAPVADIDGYGENGGAIAVWWFGRASHRRNARARSHEGFDHGATDAAIAAGDNRRPSPIRHRRSLGDSASCSPSPSRLKAITERKMAKPGKVTIHH
jgi:hypothetical protein